MLLTRVSFDLDGLLGKYKQLHGGRQERQAGRQLRGEPEPDNGAPAPPPDSQRRAWAGFEPQGPQMFEERIREEEKEQKLKEAIARGSVRALEKLRNTDECPNPECKQHGATFEVDPGGDAVCPRCGATKERVEEEMDSGEAQIVNLTDKRTFEDGPDNRKHTELLEKQEQNVALYVIQPKDVPNASGDQIWWANNRMNQSMLWADLMGTDFEMEGGFGISESEIREVKQLLRQVSVQAAMDLATDFYDGNEEEDEDHDSSEDFLMGSPLLWTILLTLHVMTMRQEGFKVATETQQQYATLRDLHAYMRKFASDQMKMYRENVSSFFTNVKGLDAKKAAARMDRVKKRSAAYYPLGSDPAKLNAKIEKLNELLMQTKGNRDGLAKEVLQDERPELLPLEARRRHVTARDSAAATQDTDTMLVKGKKNRATARDRWGIPVAKVEVDRSGSGGKGSAQGGRGKGGGRGGGKGKGKGGKGKGGKGRGLSLANLQGEGDNPYDSDKEEESNQAPGELMFATIARESKEADARARAEAERKEREEKAQKDREKWAQKSAWKDELGDALGTNNYGDAGGSSSSGPAYDPELLALSVEELEEMIAEKESFLLAEKKSGNYSKEVIEEAQHETVRLKNALYHKHEMDQEEPDSVFNEDMMGAMGMLDEEEEGGEGDAMNVDGDNDDNDDNDDTGYDSGDRLAPELVGEDGNFVNEEAEAAAMVDLLSIDLSPEAFERHQQEQLQALIEQEKRNTEMVQAEREAREAEAARKQAEREAQYKQDGPYDRKKDPRNDVEGFIAAGMPIPTPKGTIDGYSGSNGKYYTSDKQIRTLTLQQVQASRNFRKHPRAFVKKWQRLQREWRADAAAKMAKFKDLERKKAESRAKREEAARVDAAKKMEKLAERGFDQMMTQAAKKEKAEERAEKQGKATMYVKPSDEVADKTTEYIPPVTLAVAQPSVPKIIIPAEAMKQANASEDAKTKAANGATSDWDAKEFKPRKRKRD